MSLEFEIFLWIIIVFPAVIIVLYRILIGLGVIENGRFCKRNN